MLVHFFLLLYIMAEQFPQFAFLPEELRRYIWRLSLQPRIIETYLHDPCHSRPKKAHPYFTQIPATLRVSVESRSETRPFYKNCGGRTYYAAEGSLINPLIDTLHCSRIPIKKRFSNDNSVQSATARERLRHEMFCEVLSTGVTSLAIPLNFFASEGGWIQAHWVKGDEKWPSKAVDVVRQHGTLRELILTQAIEEDGLDGMPWGLEPHGFKTCSPGRRYVASLRDVISMFEQAEAKSAQWNAPEIRHASVLLRRPL